MLGTSVAYHLNGPLRDWAYGFTRDTPLPDSDAMKTSRVRYAWTVGPTAGSNTGRTARGSSSPPPWKTPAPCNRSRRWRGPGGSTSGGCVSAAENLEQENRGLYSAFGPSVEAAYRVGSEVVHKIVAHWDRYEKTLPGEESGGTVSGRD